METTLIPIFATIFGTVLGYWLHSTFQEEVTRRLILREIAFEYRRLANSRETGGVPGLIRAGILQCSTERETREVLSLIEDLAPELEVGTEWQPKKEGRILKLLRTLRERDGIDARNSEDVAKVRMEIDGETRPAAKQSST